MLKPLINLDELELVADEEGPFKHSHGGISDKIGARKLGYNLSVVPPGKKVCPFHNHQVGEEMFLILEGEGTLRFGDKEYPLRKHDVIACPPGGREVAHQIINTGKTDLKYFALGTQDEADVCEYPDSNKVMLVVGERGKRRIRHMFRSETEVEYMDRETK